MHEMSRAVNEPLTILGLERRWFAIAVMFALIVFKKGHTMIGGLVVGFALYWFFRWATKDDPKAIEIWMRTRSADHYDPVKRAD